MIKDSSLGNAVRAVASSLGEIIRVILMKPVDSSTGWLSLGHATVVKEGIRTRAGGLSRGRNEHRLAGVDHSDGIAFWRR